MNELALNKTWRKKSWLKGLKQKSSLNRFKWWKKLVDLRGLSSFRDTTISACLQAESVRLNRLTFLIWWSLELAFERVLLELLDSNAVAIFSDKRLLDSEQSCRSVWEWVRRSFRDRVLLRLTIQVSLQRYNLLQHRDVKDWGVKSQVSESWS